MLFCELNADSAKDHSFFSSFVFRQNFDLFKDLSLDSSDLRTLK